MSRRNLEKTQPRPLKADAMFSRKCSRTRYATPADTVMRGVDATRPVRVLRVIDPDDPETPVRIVHAGRRYAIWWLDADATVRTGMLLTRPGLVSVATSDSTAILPEGGGA